jgi:ABC-type lipoprotein release transport system permease subunit
MSKWIEIASTGLDAVLLHRLRSVVTTLAILAVLVPYITGLGLSQGVQRQAMESIQYGADLYVTATRFGRTAPLPIDAVGPIAQLEGVVRVTPRIVGTISLGSEGESAVIVGTPLDHLPPTIECVEGTLFDDSKMNQLVVGSELARRLRLKVGSLIPPFYQNRDGERISKVVGIFRSDVSIWQARVIFTSFETAAAIYDQRGVATDLLVYCRPGEQATVAAQIMRSSPLGPDESGSALRMHITPAAELKALLPQGLLQREGIFTLHYLLAFTIGILVILVTSGLGLSERRREIGILKATGWQTDEILLRSLVESCVISVIGASAAAILAFVWLRFLNGVGIAAVFLTGADVSPSFRVPYRLAPVPILLCFLLSFVLVLTGTLYSSWRAAIVAPAEAMR